MCEFCVHVWIGAQNGHPLGEKKVRGCLEGIFRKLGSSICNVILSLFSNKTLGNAQDFSAGIYVFVGEEGDDSSLNCNKGGIDQEEQNWKKPKKPTTKQPITIVSRIFEKTL